MPKTKIQLLKEEKKERNRRNSLFEIYLLADKYEELIDLLKQSQADGIIPDLKKEWPYTLAVYPDEINIGNGGKSPQSVAGAEQKKIKLSALAYAVLRGQYALAETLIVAGADVNFKNTLGHSILQLILFSENTAIHASFFSLLLKNGAKPPTREFRIKLLKALLILSERQLVDNLVNEMPLTEEECGNDHKEIPSMLSCAISTGNITFLKYLQGKLDFSLPTVSADETINELNGLQLAVYYQQLEAIKFFLDAGMNINSRTSNENKTLLMIATHKDDADLIHFLLNNGVKLEDKDHEDKTALTYAIMAGTSCNIVCLVACGAKMSLADFELAVLGGDELVYTLLRAQVSLDGIIDSLSEQSTKYLALLKNCDKLEKNEITHAELAETSFVKNDFKALDVLAARGLKIDFVSLRNKEDERRFSLKIKLLFEQAVINNNYQLAREILAIDSPVGSSYQSDLLKAAFFKINQVAMLDLFVEHGWQLLRTQNNVGDTLLMYAFRQNNLQLFKRILDYDIKRVINEVESIRDNKENKQLITVTDICEFRNANDQSIVGLTAGNREFNNAITEQELRIYVGIGNIKKVAEKLEKKGFAETFNGSLDSLLHTAVQYQQESSLVFLIAAKANLRHVNADGQTIYDLPTSDEIKIQLKMLKEYDSDKPFMPEILDVQSNFQFFYALITRDMNLFFEKIKGSSFLARYCWNIAFRYKDMELFEECIKRLDVNALDEDGETPLFIATGINNLEMVKRLLEAGTNPLLKNKDGKIAAAIATNHSKVQAMLVEAASKLFLRNLVTFIGHGQVEDLKNLLEAEKYLLDLIFRPELLVVFFKAITHRPVMDFFIQKMHDNNQHLDGKSFAMLVLESGNSQLFKMLLDKFLDELMLTDLMLNDLPVIEGVDLLQYVKKIYAENDGFFKVKQSAKNKLADQFKLALEGHGLKVLIASNQFEAIERILEKRPDLSAVLDSNNNSLLHLAIKDGEIGLVCLLLKYDFELSLQNNDEKTVMDLAEEMEIEQIQQLLNVYHRRGSDQSIFQCFVTAAMRGDFSFANNLMKIRPNVHLEPLIVKEYAGYIYSFFWTLAIQYKHTKLCNDLIAKKLQIDIRDQDGNTPLHLAIINGELEIVKNLLAAGAALGIKNNAGKMPKHLPTSLPIAELLDKHLSLQLVAAVKTGNVDDMKMLLAAGGDLTKNPEGYSYLFLAIHYKKLDILQLVLAHNSPDMSKKCKAGYEPLQAAIAGIKKEEHIYIIYLLRTYGLWPQFTKKPESWSASSFFVSSKKEDTAYISATLSPDLKQKIKDALTCSQQECLLALSERNTVAQPDVPKESYRC